MRRGPPTSTSTAPPAVQLVQPQALRDEQTTSELTNQPQIDEINYFLSPEERRRHFKIGLFIIRRVV